MADGGSLVEHFGSLEDPRVVGRTRHKLMDIILIAICGTICNADNWVDIEAFGHAKEEWLRTFLELPNGIPSHDTFGRVFALIDTEQFQACFHAWVQAAVSLTEKQVVAIDGKTARRTHDREAGRSSLHMISAWATENHLVLAQRAVEEGHNEIHELPALLRLLDISGCIVTIDAIGCQREIAQQIRDQDGDYVLAVKGNQPKLNEGIISIFSTVSTKPESIRYQRVRTVEKGHGRIETREVWTVSDPEYLNWIDPDQRWPGMRSVAMVIATRRQGDNVSHATRYYVSSLDGSAETIAGAIRSHWGIENSLHWVLDVAFDNDGTRVRTGHAPANLTVLQHIALNLIKQDKTARKSVKGRRLLAAWDNDYLWTVLNASPV